MKLLKKYFVAHKANQHIPHILRARSAIVLVYLVVLFFFGAYVQSRLTGDENFLSSILPAVLVDLANENRLDHDLASLKINPLLEEAAKLKAEDMAKHGYFAHNSPQGLDPWFFFKKVGYSYAYAGENLAMDFHDSEAVDNAWMASSGHRENILNNHFSEIGVAAATGEIDGRKTIFVVQMFGRPKSTAIALAQENPISNPIAEAPLEETEPIVESAQDQPEEVLVEESERDGEMFIAVQALDSVPAPSEEGGMDPGGYSNFFRRMLSSPTNILATIYAILGLLVLFAIGSVLIKEVKLHHMKHLAYGFSVLILMAGLLSIFYQLLFSEVLII